MRGAFRPMHVCVELRWQGVWLRRLRWLMRRVPGRKHLQLGRELRGGLCARLQREGLRVGWLRWQLRGVPRGRELRLSRLLPGDEPGRGYLRAPLHGRGAAVHGHGRHDGRDLELRLQRGQMPAGDRRLGQGVAGRGVRAHRGVDRRISHRAGGGLRREPVRRDRLLGRGQQLRGGRRGRREQQGRGRDRGVGGRDELLRDRRRLHERRNQRPRNLHPDDHRGGVRAGLRGQGVRCGQLRRLLWYVPRRQHVQLGWGLRALL